MIATERKSTLAVKLEMTDLVGTVSATGTALTGSGTAFDTALTVGQVIGNDTVGYRSVVAIASGTALTVDTAFDTNFSGATLQKQTYSTDPTIGATNVIEFVDFTFEPDRGEITRNVVNRSYDEIEPVMGSETVAGNIQCELHGSGTSGVQSELHPLWLCAMGESAATSTTTTTSGSSTTSIKLATGGGAASKLKIGQHIMLDPTVAGTGAYEVSRVTNIATDTLTVSPAFTLAPPTGRTVYHGIHYRCTVTELPSLWVQYWRGDITKETYRGNKVSSLSLDFTSGQTVNPTFGFQGKDTNLPVSESYTLGTPAYDSGNVHVARYMALKVGGTTYPVANVKIDIANELYRREDISSAGTKELIRTKRTISGSFSLLYEDKAIETAFRNGTTAELIVASSDGNLNFVPGNTFVMSMPKIKYTKAGKSKDNGLYKYDVTFKAVRTLGEDALWVSFL